MVGEVREACIALARRLAVGAAVIGLSFGVTETASAATFDVTTTADEFGGFLELTGCGLREAIEAANTDGNFGGCVGADQGSDTIRLVGGMTPYGRTKTGSDDTNATGDLDVLNEDLTIVVGSGTGFARIQGNGANTGDRVIDIEPTGSDISVLMSGMLVENGNTAGLADNAGGGIRTGGPLTLLNSTVRSNQAGGSGGGITNGSEADASMTLANVTIFGNSTTKDAGGLNNSAGATSSLNNVTVAQNTANSDADAVASDVAGGIQNFIGTLKLSNTIVADNSNPINGVPDCSGTVTSLGYNLIGNTTGCPFAPTTGDTFGASGLAGGLNNASGFFELPLLPGSQAIDAGNPAAPDNSAPECMTEDQRGVGRPQGPRCDKGAYEVQSPPAPILTATSPASGANDNQPEIKGTAEANSTVKIYTTSDCSGTPVATGTAAQLAGPGITVTVPDNSTTTFRATATNAQGGTSTCSGGITYTEVTPGPPPPAAAALAECAGLTVTIAGALGEAVIAGTDANDTITGTPAADVIDGGNGNDTIRGLAGNDVICGGNGNDTLKGGKGKDELRGQNGSDTLKGGKNKDILIGGRGKDTRIQ